MEFIKIGNIEIRKESLKGLSMKKAKEIYKNIPEKTLKKALELCNPKPKKKKKS